MTESIVRDEILDSISFINECVEDSAMSVFGSIIQEYEKISTMIDNAGNDLMFVQEGQVWDTATGKDKVESGLFKLIAFIPRLFQGIFNAITSVFKKDSEKSVAKNAELAKNALATYDETKLATVASTVNETTEDNIGFDPKKKEFVLKRGLRHIRNYIYILTSFPELFKKFIIKLKGGETPYDSMLNELKQVLTGKKSLDSESFYVSVDALHELYKDGYNASMGVRGLTSELSMLLEKKMRADFENGKNIDKQAKAKQFLDEVSGTSKIVMNVTFGLKMISKVLYIFGGPLYRKFRNGMTIDEEDIERQNTSQEKQDLKNKLKSLKEQYKTLKGDKKRKDKKREDILDLEAKIKALEEKISKTEDKRDWAEDLDKKGDAEWRDPKDPTDPDSDPKHKMVTDAGASYDPKKVIKM